VKIAIAIGVFILTFAIVGGGLVAILLPSLWDHGGPSQNVLSNVLLGLALLLSLWASVASYRYMKSNESDGSKAAP
jgi:hypothetical protein